MRSPTIWLAEVVRPVGWAIASALVVASCATYENQLVRGHRAFEENEHERALAIFRGLEPDIGRLSVSDRAHYAYLRGMTDYRVGYKAEARHWLSLAAAIEQQTPGSLTEDWTKRMNESLKELNEEVYTAGIAALSNGGAPTPDGKGNAEDNQTPPATAPADAPKSGNE
jgi:hypothetical protein